MQDRFGLTVEDYIRIWKNDPSGFRKQLETDAVEYTEQLQEACKKIQSMPQSKNEIMKHNRLSKIANAFPFEITGVIGSAGHGEIMFSVNGLKDFPWDQIQLKLAKCGWNSSDNSYSKELGPKRIPQNYTKGKQTLFISQDKKQIHL